MTLPAVTLHAWARAYLLSADLATKFDPPPPPEPSDDDPVPASERDLRPGRPPELQRIERAGKSPGRGALADPKRRAWLWHTFLHHELQAAELMAWAIVAFPETPAAFRRGVAAILLDEVRHMAMYRTALADDGARVGDFGVRDWFWQRVPAVRDAAGFCAVMGMGLEAANLDHGMRYASWLREAGCPSGAAIQDTIADEELPHVRFGLHWFKRFTGAADFDTWRAHLPPPLTPALLRGNAMNRAARTRAGMERAFLDALEASRFDPAGARA